MKRRLEDLHFRAYSPTKADEQAAAHAEHFLSRISDMLESDQFEWARDTLEGIYKTVEERETVTAAQARAVENIAAARGW